MPRYFNVDRYGRQKYGLISRYIDCYLIPSPEYSDTTTYHALVPDKVVHQLVLGGEAVGEDPHQIHGTAAVHVTERLGGLL